MNELARHEPIDPQKLLQAFLSRRAKTTIEAYRGDMEMFAAFCGVATPIEAGALLVKMPHGNANALADRYRDNMIAQKLAPNTINRRLSALRSICKLAQRYGMIQWNLSVDNVKKEKRRDSRGPSTDAVMKMIEYAGRQKNKIKAARDVAMLAVFFSDGLRRSELMSCDITSLDLEAGTISIVGKGHSEAVKLPLNEKVVVALKAWLKVRPKTDKNLPAPLFLNRYGNRLGDHGVYYVVRAIGAKCGLKVRCHGLRHACFTHGARQGIPLHELKALSRHADIRTLEGYIDEESGTAKKVSDKISEGLNLP